jgi:membrane protein DedA with SNARE-associated domain
VGLTATLVSAETLDQIWGALSTIDPHWALAVVAVLLFLAGCGFPLPEDIPLTFSGILLSLAPVREHLGGRPQALLLVSLTCYVSIITGDLVAYWLGRTFGRGLARYRPFRWLLPEHRVERLEAYFHRFGSWTVFFGRMVAGIRFVTFAMAGMAAMPRWRFVLFDSLAALVTVPAWLVLGYMLGTHFHDIVTWMSRISTTTWIVVGVAALALSIHWWRRRQVRRRQMGTRQVPPFVPE